MKHIVKETTTSLKYGNAQTVAELIRIQVDLTVQRVALVSSRRIEMTQANLFGETVKVPTVNMSAPDWKGEKKRTEQVGLKPVDGEFITNKQAEDKRYTKAYCMNMIEGEGYLWDMRCWNKYKDRAEMMEWLGRIEQGKDVAHNCGHTHFCIERLLNKKLATKEEIAVAMLKNSNKQYAKRLVKCWDNPKLCPKFKAQGDYGNEICNGCQ